MASSSTAVTKAVPSQGQNQSIALLHGNAAIVNTGLPHGLGLLTTVASLPPKYRSRYLSITTKCETPLDLSVKPISPEIANDVPIAASFTEVYTEPSSEPDVMQVSADINRAPQQLQQQQRQVQKDEEDEVEEEAVIEVTYTGQPITSITSIDIAKSPITPPPTPTKRKLSEHSSNHDADGISSIEPELCVEQFIIDNYTMNPMKMAKTNENLTTKRDCTPVKPIKATDTAPKTVKSQPPAAKPTKNKATRKLKFDEETSSPVSGTIIRPLEDITDGTVQYSNGDIDPKYNIVEITEETKAELAAIKNVIGDYICKLCRLKFDDAFGLAQHRCACIVLLEYRCPECGKQFNCPANLASHRRWHKPKKEANSSSATAAAKKENRNTTNTTMMRQVHAKEAHQRRNNDGHGTATYACEECGKGFKRQAYLRKHQLTHGKQSQLECEPKAVGITSARIAAIEANGTTTTTTAATTTKTFTMTATMNSGGYKEYRVGSSSSGASLSLSLSSSSSSLHSYSGASAVHEDETGMTYMVNGNNAGNTNAGYDYDIDSMSDCSNSSTGYGRLQIVESGLTEEENIAAAALTNLRNCASVIQHTTLAH